MPREVTKNGLALYASQHKLYKQTSSLSLYREMRRYGFAVLAYAGDVARLWLILR